MELENVWIIAAAALAAGALIGYLIGRSGDAEQQKRKLEEELSATRQEMDSYKKEVTSHFEQTATLVNELTEHYRRVHQHLASSAQSLCPNQPAGSALTAPLQPTSPLAQLDDQAPAETEKTATPAATKTTAVDNPSKEKVKAEASEEPEVAVEPPRDYAPKKPDDEGTLSDRYGLKKSADKVAHPIPDLASPDSNESEEPEKRTVH